MTDLNIAESPFDDGSIRFRYARKLSDDGARWIRHGLFVAYHPNGGVASEGQYEDGLETGIWRDFHENGQIAAEGAYLNGEETGDWRYWTAEGVEEVSTD